MADLKKKSVEDMKKSVLEKRVQLRDFRFGGAGSRTRDVRKGRTLRKEIARILTELRNRAKADTNTRA